MRSFRHVFFLLNISLMSVVCFEKIYITGSNGHQGEIYIPYQQDSIVADNFGYDSTHKWPAVTVCSNNQMYISGGFTNSTPIRHILQFDPATNQSRTFSNILKVARGRHSMDCLGYDSAHSNAALLLCGGSDGDNYLASCELCHTNPAACVPFSSLLMARHSHSSIMFNQTIIIVLGGQGTGGVALSTVEYLDLYTTEWFRLAPMSSARDQYPGLAVLHSNELLVCGGATDGTEAVASCETISWQKNEWRVFARLNIGRANVGMETIGQSVYVLGGTDPNGLVLDSAEVYVEKLHYWMIYNQSMILPALAHTAVKLPYHI